MEAQDGDAGKADGGMIRRLYGSGPEMEWGIGAMLLRGWRPREVTPLEGESYAVRYVGSGHREASAPPAPSAPRTLELRDLMDALTLVNEPGVSAEIEGLAMESLIAACTESHAVQLLLAADEIAPPDQREWVETFAWFILDSRRGRLPGWSRYCRPRRVAA